MYLKIVMSSKLERQQQTVSVSTRSAGIHMPGL